MVRAIVGVSLLMCSRFRICRKQLIGASELSSSDSLNPARLGAAAAACRDFLCYYCLFACICCLRRFAFLIVHLLEKFKASSFSMMLFFVTLFIRCFHFFLWLVLLFSTLIFCSAFLSSLSLLYGI